MVLRLASDARLYFRPNPDFNGTITNAITFRAWDQSTGSNGTLALAPSFGGSSSSSTALDTASITVTAVNDAPVNTVRGAQSVNEDTNLAISGLAIADLDAGAGVLTTTLLVNNGVLTVASSGGAVVSDSGTSWVMLTGTLAQINTTLAAPGAVIYTPSLNFNGITNLFMTTGDNGNTGVDPSAVGQPSTGGPTNEADNDPVQITVNAVNDTPVNQVPASIAVVEDGASALTGIVFTDVDTDGGNGIATLSAASGTLAATTGGGVTVAGSGTNTVTLAGTRANINAFIAGANVTFTTASNATANVNLTVTFNDGGDTGIDPGLTGNGTSEQDTDVVTLTVTAVNDAPVNTVPDVDHVVDEDAGIAIAGLAIADVDAVSAELTDDSLGCQRYADGRRRRRSNCRGRRHQYGDAHRHGGADQRHARGRRRRGLFRRAGLQRRRGCGAVSRASRPPISSF